MRGGRGEGVIGWFCFGVGVWMWISCWMWGFRIFLFLARLDIVFEGIFFYLFDFGRGCIELFLLFFFRELFEKIYFRTGVFGVSLER